MDDEESPSKNYHSDEDTNHFLGRINNTDEDYNVFRDIINNTDEKLDHTYISEAYEEGEPQQDHDDDDEDFDEVDDEEEKENSYSNLQ